jgi:hypothetical protein
LSTTSIVSYWKKIPPEKYTLAVYVPTFPHEVEVQLIVGELDVEQNGAFVEET